MATHLVRMAVATALICLLAGRARTESDIAPDKTFSRPAPYMFSDELGGFSIVAVSGVGTRSDPVLVSKIVRTHTSATMIIRATRPINAFGQTGYFSTGTVHIVLDIMNDTGVPWIGFELELQEEYEQPSVYGDGLSFDQRRQEEMRVFSSAFAHVRRDFEPFDRLLFEQGALDHRARARFRFLVTDLTPTSVFYIKFDPRIPAS
ncbi:hypothetical protein [Oricola cellulosilytica]|uniref:Uncharacterized protein n=1 Tax=Oricola cellulosilytica TaxID=1429082 RepID=A0A4R0PA84_9HYPH|nr:hypothetical protein [Oricola cellulosilytica]TCD14152.1 hypothetical protein E0D97_08655 [Oricola cellulosilytica]